MATELKYPKPGDEFFDVQGRKLLIRQVRPGDELGREIVGLLYMPGSGSPLTQRYVCNQKIWMEVWEEKKPRWEGQV